VSPFAEISPRVLTRGRVRVRVCICVCVRVCVCGRCVTYLNMNSVGSLCTQKVLSTLTRGGLT